MTDGVSALRAAFVRHSQTIRAHARREIEGRWTDATVELTDVAMNRFTDQAATLADAAQGAMASATVAYLDGLERIVTGHRAGRFSATADTMTLRGVDAAELWHRPVVRVWRALSEGRSPARAVQIGRARAAELATTGLQLAHTRTAGAWMGTAPVQSYRASLNGPCGLCALAATVTYAADAPMPIHPHCSCVVWPRFAGHPPMRPGGEPTREATRSAVSELTGQSAATPETFARYVAVVEHGEIGPLLRRRGDHFTGPSEIDAA